MRSERRLLKWGFESIILERTRRSRNRSFIFNMEQTEKIRQYFDAVAKRYDLMNSLLSFGIHHIWKRAAVGKLDLKPGDRVLDVCGGTGDLAVLASKGTRTEHSVTVYDMNRAMIDAGRFKKSDQRYRKRLQYIQGDAEIMPFADHTFDAAMVGFGIRNVVNMETGFKEMHRILKPGGRLMCLEFSTPDPAWFRRTYDFYSFRVIPLLGGIVTGSRQAYTHLPVSIRTFPLPDALSDILKYIGFKQVGYHKLTRGIAVIHVGIK